jgi:hypothetical protein
MEYAPNHPYKNNKNYVREHRLMMEHYIGRILLPTEVVHHINNVPYDNRIENLILFSTKADHTRHHNPNGVKSNKQEETNHV